MSSPEYWNHERAISVTLGAVAGGILATIVFCADACRQNSMHYDKLEAERTRALILSCKEACGHTGVHEVQRHICECK